MTEIDACLARAPAAARATLEKLREAIHRGAGGHRGHPLSGAGVRALADYTSKGTIRFPHDKPLPAALVKKIFRARMAENERRSQKKPKR